MRILFTSILAVALVCILANQINNLAYVLAVGSPDYSAVYGLDWRILAAVSWSVGIELGVLVSVLSGKRKQAAVLAVMSCAVNLAANQVWMHPVHIFVAKTTVYALSAYLLWFFSELVGTYYANTFTSWFTSLQAHNLVNSPVNSQSELFTDSVNEAQTVYEKLPVNSKVNEFTVRKQPQNDNGKLAEMPRLQDTIPSNIETINKSLKKNENSGEVMFDCPYCDWKGSSRQARHNHINRNHLPTNS